MPVDPLRSQRLAPAPGRDRRQAAGPADRPGGDRVAGRSQQERRQSARVSTGARGRDHPPARRTSPWRLPCRNSRSHVAGDVGSNGPVAIPFFGRRIRPCRSAGVLGSGARPLRQQHADVGLRHRRSGDPRSGRRNRLGRRVAAAEGRRTRSVVAAFAVDRRRRAAGRRAPAVRCARQRPCRYRCAGDRARRTRGERSRSHLARCGMFRGDQPGPDLGASLDRRAGMHLRRVQRSRQGGLSDRGGRLCADLGQTPRRLSLGTGRRASSGCCRSAATRCHSRHRLSPQKGRTHDARTGADAPPGHSRHQPLCWRRSEGGWDRAPDPPRLERERARAEQQGDRGLPGSRRRDPSLSGRERPGVAGGTRAMPRDRSRRGSFAAPVPTS